MKRKTVGLLVLSMVGCITAMVDDQAKVSKLIVEGMSSMQEEDLFLL